MFAVLFFTIAGFLAGLAYVMVKRKIRPGAILTAAFTGLVSAAVWKAVKHASKGSGKHTKY